MSTSPESPREETHCKILRETYLLCVGNLRVIVSFRELHERTGIPLVSLREHCRHLQEQGEIAEKYDVNLLLTASGITRAEMEIWRQWARKAKGDPGLKGHHELLVRMEWLRYRTLMHLLGGRVTGDGFRDLDPLLKEQAKQIFGLEATLAHLAAAKHIDFRGNPARLQASRARLTATGAEMADKWNEILQGKEIPANDFGKFQEILERERRREMVGSSAQGSKAKSKTFPTPVGTDWKDVAIRFLDDGTASVRVKNVTRVINATQMGMVDSRTGMPDSQWRLLEDLAEGHGILNWSSRRAFSGRQKHKARLSKTLQMFFGLSGEPIPWDRKQREWKAIFRVSRGSRPNPPRSIKPA